MKRHAWLWAVALLTALVVPVLPAAAANIPVVSPINTDQTWTNDNTYILTEPVYVTAGATLTIQEGTVIRGEGESAPGANDPGALIIARDAKIKALGTPKSPIVFTDLFDDNIGPNPGTPPYDSAPNAVGLTGQWGGVILLSRGWVSNNTAGGADATREVQIEGLVAAGGLGLYGNCAAGPLYTGDLRYDAMNCNEHDSGGMRYVSIRYGGFNLSAANEINGLTLGAVGRPTLLEYIEVFQNQDDSVECFGGAPQMKRMVFFGPGDDGLDYDEGYSGKAQFVFLAQSLPGDKGGEHDGGNSPDGSRPLAIPTFYNVTSIGVGPGAGSTNTALNLRDNAGGRYYNSLFADWGGAAIQIEGVSCSGGDCSVGPVGPNTSAERANTAYNPAGECLSSDGLTFRGSSCNSDLACAPASASCPGCQVGDYCKFGFYVPPDSTYQLELTNNEWYCVQRQEDFCFGGAVDDDGTSGCGDIDTGELEYTGDAGKTGADVPGGLFNLNRYESCADPLPIRQLTRFGGPATPVAQVDPRPAAGSKLSCATPGNCRAVPNDGFFEPAGFQGAFDGMNWAEGWSNMSRMGYFPPKPQVPVVADIVVDTLWTADNEYILDKPIYVTNGATLTIEQGTTVRGQGESAPGANDPGTLIIARDSRINAVGSVEKPIVFTNLDDDNIGIATMGTPPYDQVTNSLGITGTWGGVILLGRGLVSNNTATAPNTAREVQIEGLVAAGGLGLYGNCATLGIPIERCDDDNSGRLTYASIRYGGFNLSAANEINGLTLGALGRETQISHVEIYQNQDDGIESFGGAAEMDHIVVYAVGDDSLDYDEGWKGKAQFYFVVQGPFSDKGGEHDGGNSPDGSLPLAIPELRNFTYIGQGQKIPNPTNTALNMRDNAGGAYSDSLFYDFSGAAIQIEGVSCNAGDCTVGPVGPNTSAERASTSFKPGSCYNAGAPGASSNTRCTANADCLAPEVCIPFYPDPVFDLEVRDSVFQCIGRQEAFCFGGAVDDFGTQGCGSLDTGELEYTGDAGKTGYDNGMLTNVAAFNNALRFCADPLPIRTLRRIPAGPGIPDPVISIDPRPAPGGPLEASALEGSLNNGMGVKPTGYKGAFGGKNWAQCWTNLGKQGGFTMCDPASGTPTTAVPDPTENLRFVDASKQIAWDGPCGLVNTASFDLLRTDDPMDFTVALIKPQWDDTVQPKAIDTDPPALGSAFFYVSRANNACGNGTIGEDSAGVTRPAP